MKQKIAVFDWDKLEDRQPAYALVRNTDLVVVRYDDTVSVLYGRCLHRGALRLRRFFEASVELMQVMARACGHTHLSQFCRDDLTTFNRDMAYLTGISYGGVTPL